MTGSCKPMGVRTSLNFDRQLTETSWEVVYEQAVEKFQPPQ
jgi:hypothetical protein